jgi:hypothetical protein
LSDESPSPEVAGPTASETKAEEAKLGSLREDNQEPVGDVDDGLQATEADGLLAEGRDSLHAGAKGNQCLRLKDSLPEGAEDDSNGNGKTEAISYFRIKDESDALLAALPKATEASNNQPEAPESFGGKSRTEVRLSGQQGRSAGLGIRLAGLETGLTGQRGRLAGPETRLTGQQGRLAGPETRLTVQQSRLAGPETWLAGVEVSLTSAASRLAGTEASLAAGKDEYSFASGGISGTIV